MACSSITLEVRLAWWFWPYFETLIALCLVLGTEPDPDKLERMIVRAIKVRPAR
jgi:hypothetical protein